MLLRTTTLILLGALSGKAFPSPGDSTLVWPTPPDRARIRYVETISQDTGAGEERGFLSKLFGFLTGGVRPPEWLVQPVGIAVSPDGVIVVSDPGSRAIHIFDRAKHEHRLVTETKFGKFIAPVGLAFGPDGSLYVSDSDRGDITVLDRDFEATSQIKGSLNRPTGLCIFGNRLFAVDSRWHKVFIFALDGTPVASFGRRGAGTGEFNFPVQIGARDSLYVVDQLNYRVQKFDAAGNFGSSFGMYGNVAGRFASPKAIAFDSDNHCYVTDALMDNLQIFSSAGQLLLIVGRQGRLEGEFLSPGGIAIDRNDRIFVVEMLNRRIQIFQYLK